MTLRAPVYTERDAKNNIYNVIRGELARIYEVRNGANYYR